ncbi:MAG: hypothetical protein NXI24_24230 [bacterium]|nr:hypothetical protein [bacterium]
MLIRLIQFVTAGLFGGLLFGAVLAGLHSAAPGGVGAIGGLILGGISGGVLGLTATLLVGLVLALIQKLRGGLDWSPRRWRWTGFAIGAIGVILLHVVDIYII